MKNKESLRVFTETGKNPNNELHGDDLAAAAVVNLLITAALTRSSSQALSELSPTLARQCSSVIRAMVEAMQFASSEMGLNLIPSSFVLVKTWDFTLTGSLRISSDEFGIAVELIDTELVVSSEPATINLVD